ncbi:MAG: response regulator [Kofleriaceae bacterium]
MPTILTVDDSSTIRTIITKQMTELGFAVEAAEDGQQGLAKLEDISVDLILLDVTMPVMDGPAMLAKLRETGNTTPVIMLTSESKRAVVSGAIKLGIDDYILKPFKPDELRAKVMKALRLDPTAGTGPVTPAPAAAVEAAASGSKQFTDVLVIDDMENVHKKLRTLLPAHLTMNGCVSAREAVNLCQERIYRVIIIDMVIPDVNSVALMNQLRVLQPHAIMAALALRSANDVVSEHKAQGFQDVLQKPFDPDAIDEVLGKYFDVKEVLSIDGNVLRAAAFEGKDDKLDRYFTRLKQLGRESFEKLASACYEDAIIDVARVPVRADKIVRLAIELDKEAKKFGIEIRLIGTAEHRSTLASVTDTASMPFFDSIDAARAA